MAIQIKLKNSVVQDSTPSTSDLPAVGEIALNANINSIGGFMRASDNSIVKIFGPGSLSTPTATTTVAGISELATNTETTTGSATNRVVTPAGLNAVTVAERTTSNTNYVAKAGSTLTGVLTMPNGSNSAPAINFGDSDSGIFGGTNTVSLAAGGTTRLTADTGVSVVGTLAVTGAITSTDDLTIPDKIIHVGDTDTAIRFPAADTVSIETGSSEAVRVDSSQRLLIGTSTARAVGGESNPKVHIEGTGTTSNSWVNITRFSANNDSANIQFAKSRSNTSGTYTVVQDNDKLGQISFLGADGTDMANYAATIVAAVDGTPGSNDMPGRLVFSTTADGATSATERMRITSTGQIGIGVTPLGNNKLHARLGDASLGSPPTSTASVFLAENSGNSFITIASGASSLAGVLFADSGQPDRGQVRYNHNGDIMQLIANEEKLFQATLNGASELYFDNSKKFFTHNLGAVVQNELFLNNGNSNVFFNSDGSSFYGTCPAIGRAGGDNFHMAGTSTGDIIIAAEYQKKVLLASTNNTTGQPSIRMTVNPGGQIDGDFNDTSDANLKENINPIPDNAIADIKKLKPVTFDWKETNGNNNVSGFIAQDVKEVIPNLISGKEWSEEDQSSKYTINTIGVVAHLTKALQEAIAKIETLEIKVTKLEAL